MVESPFFMVKSPCFGGRIPQIVAPENVQFFMVKSPKNEDITDLTMIKTY